jgi:hypothetical protein
LKFTLVFYRIFQIFSKFVKIKIFNFENFDFPSFQNSNLKNRRSSNLKNCRISNRYQKVDPTTRKSTSRGAFKIVLRKSSFCQTYWEKAAFFDSTFGFLSNSRTKRTLRRGP